MKKFCCALLACLPLSVFAYPIELEKQFNGAEVSASTQEIDHNMGGLMLHNYGSSAAHCTALFRNGPEAPPHSQGQPGSRGKQQCHGQVQPQHYSPAHPADLRPAITCRGFPEPNPGGGINQLYR